MHIDTALLWWSLNILNKKRYALLLQQYGSLEAALTSLDERLLQALGVKPETVPEVLARRATFDASALRASMEQANIRLLTLEDDDYPALLRETADAPVFLSMIGDLAVLKQRCIGCVGTRRMSSYGKRIVNAFIPSLVRAGMVTVSGLAYGIDQAVAKETLQTGGKTVAVLGCGLLYADSRTKQALAERIVTSGGLLLSEYPPRMPADKYCFVARNRIIAGLCQTTLLLEAPIKSGALITADFALEEGREVCAVPGQIFDPNFAGCHALITQGRARLVADPHDILQDLPLAMQEQVVTAGLTSDEAQVWQLLTSMPQSLDDLLQQSSLPLAQIVATLTILELQGIAQRVDAAWIRT